MSFGASRALLGIFMIIFMATPADARPHRQHRESDIIFDPTDTVLGQAPSDGTLEKISGALAAVVKKFLGGFVPDPNGSDSPILDENAHDQFVKQIGNSRFQFYIQGVGTLRYLGGPYMYNDVHGALGVEYNFIGMTDNTRTNPAPTLLVVRFSPAYGEIAMVRMAAGARDQEGLPGTVVLGGQLGIEGSHKFGRFEPGFRAYVKHLWDTGPTAASGFGAYAAIYCKIKLSELRTSKADGRAAFYLTPWVEYFDRSPAQAELYNYDFPAGVYDVGPLRSLWQAQLKLEIHH